MCSVHVHVCNIIYIINMHCMLCVYVARCTVCYVCMLHVTYHVIKILFYSMDAGTLFFTISASDVQRVRISMSVKVKRCQ